MSIACLDVAFKCTLEQREQMDLLPNINPDFPKDRFSTSFDEGFSFADGKMTSERRGKQLLEFTLM
jgi:hypothetical protein